MFYGIDEKGRTFPVSGKEWAQGFEDSRRRVALTDKGRYRVSTVFLGLDHAFGGGPPLLFETMVFLTTGADWDCVRYTTIEEARAGHEAMVRRWRWYYWCRPAVLAWRRLVNLFSRRRA